MPENPYRGLPSHHFWRQSVAAIPPFAIDPLVRFPFELAQDHKVAAAGSCFAQHISQALQRHGFNYFMTEPPPAGMSREAVQADNYGVYSARYGNIYTARQLRQLIERAFGEFSPDLPEWRDRRGHFVDPFRPQIQPSGFASTDAMRSAREAHLGQVRRLVEELDVLVFTLGLTEGWVHIADGAVIPLAPGVAGGTFDESVYKFVNFSTAEIVQDLCASIDLIRKVNPNARFIFTVSPVPLIATYRDQHVLVSNTYSKASLRVAAEEISLARPGVAYFPSYEIITSPATSRNYYLDDLRSVSLLGVDHVMRVFFAHCVAGSKKTAASPPALPSELREEIRNVGQIVCDEEAIVKL
ncbi:GSCFA domain-containing protein [Labrys portucalensis]|uniref:GSCFA domain-containing protein n=1 Tax=Labrys neptuniae TaxID=376174 RepID=A0ABV6ZPH9_9HYPH|nr:GSCFA domain-containing protein [Labrys neptuniae]MDT3377439.1 GSCFA domain-containing protein [Labrys neptuniae]